MKKLTICSKCIATGADTTGYKAQVMRPESSAAICAGARAGARSTRRTELRRMQMASKHPCSGCRYWRALCSPNKRKVCHYLLDNGHKRPCRPGKECTVKDTRKIERKRKWDYDAQKRKTAV